MLQSLELQKFTEYVLWRKRRSSGKCYSMGLLSAAFLLTAALGASDLKERRTLSNPTSTIERLAHLMDSSKTGIRTPRRLVDKPEVNAKKTQQDLEKLVKENKAEKVPTKPEDIPDGRSEFSWNYEESTLDAKVSDGAFVSFFSNAKEVIVGFYDYTYKIHKSNWDYYLEENKINRGFQLAKLELLKKFEYDMFAMNSDKYLQCMRGTDGTTDGTKLDYCEFLQPGRSGTGAVGGPAPRCSNNCKKGKVYGNGFFKYWESTCSVCKGSGKKQQCRTCNGEGKLPGYFGKKTCYGCNGGKWLDACNNS